MTCVRLMSIVAVFSLGSALALVSAAVTRARAQTQAQPQPQAQVPTPPVLGNPIAAHSLDRLSATRERPLFSPGRRPPAPPSAPIVSRAPPAPPPPPPSVTLFGVVMDGEEARAIVQAGPPNEIRRVRIGDDVGGWKVTQIEQRRLVLSLDGRLATFTLFSGQAGPAPRIADKQPKAPLPPGPPTRRERRE
jgi:hypothetical protein